VTDKKILVYLVEDEPEIRRQQERLLRLQDSILLIGSAGTGEEAVKDILLLKPEIVLLDLGLPGIDGIEVTRRIKKKNDKIEIIIFTIFDEENRVLAAIKAGAAGYLLKGMNSQKMVDAIKEVSAGGSVIQSHLARQILSKFRETLSKTNVVEEKTKPQKVSPLTPREEDTLKCIAKGYSNKETAASLGVSVSTIRTHLEHIYAKMEVNNRTEAVTEGIKIGIVPLE
jgi:DNA-binding NarL/FixJ family response regulator